LADSFRPSIAFLLDMGGLLLAKCTSIVDGVCHIVERPFLAGLHIMQSAYAADASQCDDRRRATHSLFGDQNGAILERPPTRAWIHAYAQIPLSHHRNLHLKNKNGPLSNMAVAVRQPDEMLNMLIERRETV
jgi:hypothetical protein